VEDRPLFEHRDARAAGADVDGDDAQFLHHLSVWKTLLKTFSN
jgi:hypothetical protein